MTFTEKVFQLRKERDLTQGELGNAIGVDKSHVSNWEKGKSMPALENLIALARFLGVSIDYLLLDNVPREGVEAINDFELYEYFRKTETLPKDKKQAVKDFLDAFIFREKIREMPELVEKVKHAAPTLHKVAGKR
jgi:transcriptional regulator with XRE-family HTH domain